MKEKKVKKPMSVKKAFLNTVESFFAATLTEYKVELKPAIGYITVIGGNNTITILVSKETFADFVKKVRRICTRYASMRVNPSIQWVVDMQGKKVVEQISTANSNTLRGMSFEAYKRRDANQSFAMWLKNWETDLIANTKNYGIHRGAKVITRPQPIRIPYAEFIQVMKDVNFDVTEKQDTQMVQFTRRVVKLNPTEEEKDKVILEVTCINRKESYKLKELALTMRAANEVIIPF